MVNNYNEIMIFIVYGKLIFFNLSIW